LQWNHCLVSLIQVAAMQISHLIQECQHGKREAQAELYRLFAPKMLGVCYRYTKQLEDAEDILQEGFIKVFRNIHQFKQTGSLEGWIRTIMVNTTIRYLKKHVKYRHEMQFENLDLPPLSQDHPEIRLNTKDLVELIRTLPSGYQTIFNLVAIEGYEYNEITTLLKMNLNTVRSNYSRARAILIRKMEQPSINIQSS